MNRTFQAFAVLLISLAGGMLAATWTTTFPHASSRSLVSRRLAANHEVACSCQRENLSRWEEGCARDKTTGELYGCGLGLGKNGTSGKSVIAGGVSGGAVSLSDGVTWLVRIARGEKNSDWLAQWKQLSSRVASATRELASQQGPSAHSVEADYAAAELAAAGFNPRGGFSVRYFQPARDIPAWVAPETVREMLRQTLSLCDRTMRTCERQTRLWLVESKLHRPWDAAEELVGREMELAGTRYQFEEEDLNRWFETFPRPITQPDGLLNPGAPSDDSSEDSRRTMLAAAKALESLSQFLHETAENLTRRAEQDVAELHKLKSGIEERR